MDQYHDEPFLDTPGARPLSAAGPSIAVPPPPTENNLAPPTGENNPTPLAHQVTATPGDVGNVPDPGSLEDNGLHLPDGNQLEQPVNDQPEANGDGDGDESDGEDDFQVESNVEDLDIACQFVELLKKAEFGDAHDGLDEKNP